MVTGNLYGRLGNQMLIIGAIIGYAKKHGLEYHIPAQSKDERLWPAHFKNLANPKFSRFAHTVNLREKSHAYQEIPYDLSWKDSNIVLDGFFQSEEYFEDAIDEVRAAFNLGYKRAKGFVGIHVRRGDYLQFPDKHPVQSLDYFREAVNFFMEYGYKSFVVCSDDIKWCKENIESIEGAAFSYSDNKRPIDDMVMLQCCDHHILSASTFGLMAHILCPYEDKFCIAPKKWFGDGNKHLLAESIYPKNCVRL